jgi:hypothetical protein
MIVHILKGDWRQQAVGVNFSYEVHDQIVSALFTPAILELKSVDVRKYPNFLV